MDVMDVMDVMKKFHSFRYGVCSGHVQCSKLNERFVYFSLLLKQCVETFHSTSDSRTDC